MTDLTQLVNVDVKIQTILAVFLIVFTVKLLLLYIYEHYMNIHVLRTDNSWVNIAIYNYDITLSHIIACLTCYETINILIL